MNAPRVFVSHSHKDDAFTARFVTDLRAAGVEVWVDVADVRHGDFMTRINEALVHCEWLVLVQTPDSLRSPAVRTEVNAALNLVWQQRMRAVIPFIAAPCDPHDVPPTWSTLHHYDATLDGYQPALAKLLSALGLTTSLSSLPQPVPLPTAWPLPGTPGATPARLASLGFAGRNVNGVEVIIPPLCDVPAGEFLMGSDKVKDPQAYDDETPQYLTPMDHAYQIGAYPVTVAEYALAVKAKAVKEPPKWGDVDWHKQLSRIDHPVVNGAWQDCMAYEAWLAQLTGQPWRLATEADWEKAARGTDGRIYPWGNMWDKAKANTGDGGPGTTTPVGTYAEKGDASPYGAHEMVGNVWEWTSTLWGYNYPYSPGDGRETHQSTNRRVLRGGSCNYGPRSARVACRSGYDDIDFLDSFRGFRLARPAST